ncbi:alpha/beta hydrolase, partial [Micromonospora zhanjiangensis]
QLPGLDPERAGAELARLHAAFDAMTTALAAPLGAEQLDQARAGQRAMAQRYGIDPAVWVAAFDRNLSTRDGSTRMRPGPELLGQLRPAMDALDLDPVYRGATCPLLLVQATVDLPEQRPFADLYAAYRRYLAGRIAAAAEANPALRVVHLAGASHAMTAEQPHRIAELITDLLASRG